MADEKGNWSSEEIDTAAAFLNGKAQLPEDPCLHCGSKDTTIVPRIAKLDLGLDAFVQEAIPLVVVVCPNCGFVRTFASNVMGLSPRPADDKGEG